MKTRTKESTGRIFSILNLTSSEKINKKKASGVKIRITKELSKRKDGSKILTYTERFSNDSFSKILIDSKLFSKFCSIIESDINFNGSVNNDVFKIFESNEIKLFENSC